MTNRLAKETSPYLLQHADNPVEWYAWGSEAFEAAREAGKPVLLSIGYSACHWCHVMAHESFEDDETAELMNRLFVNIKVDREERFVRRLASHQANTKPMTYTKPYQRIFMNPIEKMIGSISG